MYSIYDDLTARTPAERLVELADDDDDGQADTAVTNAAIADADAEIDARLAPRYLTPFESTPAVIKSLSATLAIERLFHRRRETPPKDFQQTIAAARILLDRLANGQADIREDGLSVGRPQSDSTTRGEDRTFPDEDMGLF